MRFNLSNPDYAPPGQLLDEHLESYDMSAADSVPTLRSAEEFIQELLSGAAPLDRQTASPIMKEFGGAAETWLGIKYEYRQRPAQDAVKWARREAIWGRFLLLPRILPRAYRSLGRNQRRLPRRN